MNRDQIKDRFTVTTHQPAARDKTGFYAVVNEDRGTKKPALVYDSHAEYGHGGLFKDAKTARENGERWIEARIDQIEKIDALKEARCHELPFKLSENRTEEQRLKEERSAINKQIDAIKRQNSLLVDEAMNPSVVIDFSSSANVFDIRAAPSASDGTLHDDDDDRQQELPGLRAVEDEPEDPKGKSKAPKKKRTKKKPKAPGLNPADVAWPEDDPQISQDHDEALARMAKGSGPRSKTTISPVSRSVATARNGIGS